MPTAPESLPTAACSNARAQALEVAVGLEGEAGEPQAEGGRLGVDAVGAPDAERLGVLARPGDERVAIGGRARRRGSRPPRPAAAPSAVSSTSEEVRP